MALDLQRSWHGFFQLPVVEAQCSSDIDFFQKYIDRFQSLRRAEFSKANINTIIDGMADELKEAQKRDLAKWNRRPEAHTAALIRAR